MSEYIISIRDDADPDGWHRLTKPAEKLLRCRDCRFYEPNTYSHFTCKLIMYRVEPDGFCAWGEPREGIDE